MRKTYKIKKRIIPFFISIIYFFALNCTFFQFKADASSSIVPYYPTVSIGDSIGSGYYTLSIGNFLSHVLDKSIDAASKNMGYIWNRIVDEGYCPADLDTHRHNFVYGLTSSSLGLDHTSPQVGYYCYCNKCGQLAGDLIEGYKEENNINNSGNLILYPSQSIIIGGSGDGGSHGNVVLYDETIQNVELYQNVEGNIEGYGRYSVVWVNGAYESKLTYSNVENPNYYWVGYGALFDLKDLVSPNINVVGYSNNYKYIDTRANRTYTFNTPRVVNVRAVGNDRYVLISGIFNNNTNEYYFNGSKEKSLWLEISIEENVKYENFNYDNIEAPITYYNNGQAIYGGYSSSIVDTENNIYRNPITQNDYSINTYNYDYGTNRYTLGVDVDDDGIEDLVTVEYGEDYLTINHNGTIERYYYITNTQTPVNDVTSNGSNEGGSADLNGNININVNQVSTDTNAYITTNEDIPRGLRGLRETLATLFVVLPEMTGEFTDFMQEGFSYIPQEVTTLIVFGVSIAVFVGLFKLFWR